MVANPNMKLTFISFKLFYGYCNAYKMDASEYFKNKYELIIPIHGSIKYGSY